MMNLNPNYADPDFNQSSEDREDVRTSIFKRGEERLRTVGAAHLMAMPNENEEDRVRRLSSHSLSTTVSPKELAVELEHMMGAEELVIDAKRNRRRSRPGAGPGLQPGLTPRTRRARLYAALSFRSLKDVDADGAPPPRRRASLKSPRQGAKKQPSLAALQGMF